METRTLTVGVAAIIDKLLESSGVAKATPIRMKQGAARVLPETETTKAGKARIRANSAPVVSSTVSIPSPITAELARPAMPASVIKERAVAKSRKGMLVTQATKAACRAAVAPVYTQADRYAFACYDLMVACEEGDLDAQVCALDEMYSFDVFQRHFIIVVLTEVRFAIKAARRAAIGAPVTKADKEAARISRELFYDRMRELAIAKFRRELSEAGVTTSEINFLQRSFVKDFDILFWHNGVAPVKEVKVVATSTRGPVAPVVDNTPKVKTYVIKAEAVEAAKAAGFDVRETLLFTFHKTTLRVTALPQDVKADKKAAKEGKKADKKSKNTCSKRSRRGRANNITTRSCDMESVYIVRTNRRPMLNAAVSGAIVPISSNQQLVA